MLLQQKLLAEAVVYDDNGVLAAEIYPVEEMMNNTEYFDRLVESINSDLPMYKHINKVTLRETEFKKNTNGKITRNLVGGHDGK